MDGARPRIGTPAPGVPDDLVVLASSPSRLFVEPGCKTLVECSSFVLLHGLVGDVAKQEVVEAECVVVADLGTHGLDQLLQDELRQLGVDGARSISGDRYTTAPRWKI